MDILNAVHVTPEGEVIINDMTEEKVYPVMQIERMPANVSMHASLLTDFGGKLHSLYDMAHDPYEGYKARQYRGHSTRKDFKVNSSRNFKPWQFQD